MSIPDAARTNNIIMRESSIADVIRSELSSSEVQTCSGTW